MIVDVELIFLLFLFFFYIDVYLVSSLETLEEKSKRSAPAHTDQVIFSVASASKFSHTQNPPGLRVELPLLFCEEAEYEPIGQDLSSG